MKTKHTQGEWKSENLLGFPRMGNFPKVVSGDGSLIAELGGGELNEVEANAKLIAAAPDLLKVLIKICNDATILSLGEDNSKTVRVMTDSINEGVRAIKKATEI